VHKYQPTFKNGLLMFTHQLSPTWKGIVKVLAFDKVIRASCCYKVGNGMTI
jgi:hypothetical protein